MTMRGSRTIPVHDRDLREGIEHHLKDPATAQLTLWHGQSQFDLGMINDKELAILERLAGTVAGRARNLYNPYTGQIRKAFLPNWVGKKRDDEPVTKKGWEPTATFIKGKD